MKKILVIEDNEINQDLIARRLKKHGFDIVLASDGEEGLSMISMISPDLVLLDLSLPKMDGWEVAKWVKADKEIQHIPIIALTAHAMDGHRTSALEAGCDDYDTKPVQMKSLLEKINRLINGDGAKQTG